MDKESPGQAGVVKTLMAVLGTYVLITFAASWASIRVQIVVNKLLDAIQAGGETREGGGGGSKGLCRTQVSSRWGIRDLAFWDLHEVHSPRWIPFPAWGAASLLIPFSWKVPGSLLPWAGPSYGSSILSPGPWCSQTICLGPSEGCHG